jgi:hypothetical protein
LFYVFRLFFLLFRDGFSFSRLNKKGLCTLIHEVALRTQTEKLSLSVDEEILPVMGRSIAALRILAAVH